MNKSFLIGRLAADPELRQTGSGITVTSFTIAVDRPYQKDKDKETDWIDCVAWRKTAEFVCNYFQKGSPIVVEGSIQTRVWEDKTGQKRKSVEVVADNVEFVPAGKKSEAKETETISPAAPVVTPIYPEPESTNFTVVDDTEDLPF